MMHFLILQNVGIILINKTFVTMNSLRTHIDLKIVFFVIIPKKNLCLNPKSWKNYAKQRFVRYTHCKISYIEVASEKVATKTIYKSKKFEFEAKNGKVLKIKH